MTEILLTERVLPLALTESPDVHSWLTDSTNAELIGQLYGDRLRYDHQRGRWLLWNCHHWHQDNDGEIYRLAKEAARERYRRSVSIQDLKERQRVANWAIGSEQRGRLEAAVSLARTVRPIADSGKDWDGDHWLFGVANGVIDLKTGRLRPGRPEDRITLHSPVLHDESRTCPRWVQFLNEVFKGDRELVDYVHRALGYSLTGMTTEQVYFIAHGTGSNGKGKLIAAVRHILGQYAYDAPFATFELSNRQGIPNDLAALERRRFVTSSETNDGTRLNEARLKALSGEDPCTARYLHQEYFTFTPVCKMWLSVNHKPRIHDDSYGFWRRVRLIPFTRQFVKGKDADPALLDKLLAEAPGVLNWLIAGCLQWQRQGLEPTPAAVLSATEAYQAESDPLGQFLADCCVQKPEVAVKAAELFKAYGHWADAEGISNRDRLSATSFGKRIGHKFEKAHDRAGTSYRGIGLVVTGL